MACQKFIVGVIGLIWYNRCMMTGNKLLNPDHILKEIVEIPYGSTVADLGCGAMAFVSLAAAKIVGDQGTVYACDILKDVLSSVEAKARQAGLYNLKTVWTNLEIVGATKIPQEVDYTFLSTTLFQAKNHQAMFKEAYRLTKPGGQLMVIEWKASSGPIGPAQELRVAKEKALSLAQQVGFSLVKEFEASDSHYGLLFKK